MSQPDPVAVNAMFGRIAPSYDRVNRILTGGIDLWWRRQLVRAVARHKPDQVVDLATGSGDVAFALRRHLPDSCAITGLDFCAPMLAQAKERQNRKTVTSPIEFIEGDILNLPLPDGSVDVATISFGLRNLSSRPRGLEEIRRILKPGHGHLLVLEFTQPAGWIRPWYFFYLRRILPRLAGWISGDRAAYQYLNTSIEGFPPAEQISRELTDAGFTVQFARPMTGAIVCLHSAKC